MYAAKALLAKQGSSLIEGRQTGLDYDVSNLAALNFNSTIAGIENADAVLLVGSNPRWEAPLVATRLRKIARKGGKIFAVGPEADLAMRVEWLGDDLKVLGKLPKAVTEAFAKAERPALIIGAGGLAAGAFGAALALVEPLGLIRGDWNGFNMLHISAARKAGLILGYAQDGGIAAVESGEAGGGLAAGCRRNDRRPLRRRVQGLHRTPRRQWRSPVRSCPSGRSVHRKARDLRQYRGARAAQ